jgi:hypothetical protein
MKSKDREYLEILTWKEARESIISVNPELAKIIDAINPDKKYKLIKARYQFGDLIVQNGEFQLPIPNSPSKAAIKKALNYSYIPLAILLDKASEIFITEDERIIPLKVFKPGGLFGTFETLNFTFRKENVKPCWNVSAGSRSLIMLPKISINAGLRRMKHHFGLTSDTQARALSYHWYLFKQIANHAHFSEKWESNIICFTKDWFTFDNKDPAWFDFQAYLFKQGWLQFQESIKRAEFSISWRAFIRIVAHRRLKPTPYLIDTLKHLLLFTLGETPAFRLADSSLMAPIQGLQEAVLNTYLLKNYIPSIMVADLPEVGSPYYFYYSLAFPTLYEGTSESKNTSSTIMLDIKFLKILLETLQRDKQIDYSFLKNTKFEYFHVEDDIDGEIQSSKQIINHDHLFLKDIQRYPERIFCSTSPFWRGCIRIKA